MLRRISTLYGFKVHATDGEAGEIEDFYFDDETWTVRYAVVDTGPWILGREVLVSPHAFLPLQWQMRIIPTRLTREQIENSPEVDLSSPVVRRQLAELDSYYHWPAHWVSPAPHDVSSSEAQAAIAEAERELSGKEQQVAEIGGEKPRLHSTREVLGFRVCATDGVVGRLSDLFVDEANWIIRYLLVRTGVLLARREVLLSKDWVERINWDNRCLDVNVTREEVRGSPEYDPQTPVSTRFERELYEYYGRPGYWL